MSLKNIHLLAFEFPPFRGGIANYSESLAYLMHETGALRQVVTTQVQEQKSQYPFALKAPRANPGLSWPKIVRKPISFGYRIGRWLWFQHIIRNIAPDDHVVITTLFSNYAWMALAILIRRNISFTIVLHGLDLYEMGAKRPKRFKRVITQSHSVICNSRNTLEILIQQYPQFTSSKKTWVLSPFLTKEASESLVTQDYLLDSQAFSASLESTSYILSLCRLVPRKGIDLAITSIIPFLEQNTEWRYLIAGEGPAFGTIKKQIPAHLEDRIVMLGPVSERDKASLFRHAHCFVMPNREFSTTDVEGFGITFLEAAAHHCWIIGGDNGGVPEAVNQQLSALLIDPESSTHTTQINEFLTSIKYFEGNHPKLIAAHDWVMNEHSTHQRGQLIRTFIQDL